MKSFRKILFPFAIAYGWITTIRNTLYLKEYLSRSRYEIPVICVGNLSVGGTGKTPMIEKLITLLQDTYSIAVLSRGYGRTTKGYIEVTKEHLAIEVGDEPLQFKLKFPDVTVVVCEDRRTGIDALKNNVQVILLDDAYQHLKVTPSFTILLTAFNQPYFKDFLLPAGDLRETRKGANRADVIVVTKVPEKTSYAAMQECKMLLEPASHQKVYFSSIGYGSSIISAHETLPISYLKNKKFTLVTGIAKPKPLVLFLKHLGFTFEHLRYSDHHSFTASELSFLKTKQLILTTEKDFMRLQKPLSKYALYYLPIETVILNSQNRFFEETILEHIKRYY